MQDAPLNSNTSGGFRSKLSLSWIIFPSILLVYLLFPTKNYYWDGVFFARVIEVAPGFNSSLFHPNHLFYNAAGYVLYRTTRAVGLPWRAIEVLQIANSVVSVFTAYLLCLVLKRTLRSVYLVWCLILIFAFSSTWWKFSTDANAYIFSVFFLLLAFYFTLDEFKPRPVIVALIFSVATLLHQLAVLAYPVIALALYWQSTGMAARKRKLIVGQFCILSFLIVFTTYLYSFYLLTGSLTPARFASWITSYSPDASFSFNLFSNLRYTLRGSVRLFLQGRLSMLSGMMGPLVMIAIVIIALLVLGFIFAIVKGKSWRDLKLFTKPNRRVRVYLLWIGLYVAFLFFWLPHNGFYRLFYLPAILLLSGELLSRYEHRHKPTYRLALLTAVLVLSNFIFFIYPNSRVDKNLPLSLALEMNNVWQDNTVIYFQAENADNNLVAYFNPAAEWRLLGSVERMSVELKQVYEDGKSAWLEASAIDHLQSTPAGKEWLAKHGRLDTWRERKAAGYNIKFIQIGP